MTALVGNAIPTKNTSPASRITEEIVQTPPQTAPPVLEQLPLFLTVEEAAGVLRIGRTLAYELVHRFEATDGAAGLPVIRWGRRLVVPRRAIERLLESR